MTIQNVQIGFRGAGLVPFDLQTVLLKFDIKLQILTFSKPFITNSIPWVF